MSKAEEAEKQRQLARIKAAATIASGDFAQQRSPGPIYMPRYTVVDKRDPVLPFGTAPRYPPSSKADAVPGPGAYPTDSHGFTDGLPRIVLRGRENFGSATPSTAGDVPGPGEYTRTETTQTSKKNPPSYSLKSRHVPKGMQLFTPAPSAHQHYKPLNEYNHESTKRNAPNVKFGDPPRSRSAVQIRKEAAVSPGPGAYAKAGPGADYILKSPPKFSMCPRRDDPTSRKQPNIEPNFHKPMEGIGKQPLSTFKTLPSPSFSGRTRFGSPYA